ncbi:MAG: hypothetical protein ACKVOB_10030 [Sphingomonas sp.]
MRHILVELMHIAAGVIVALVMAKGAAWAVPLAAREIWIIAYVSVAFIGGMGLKPLAEAWRRAHAAGVPGSGNAHG